MMDVSSMQDNYNYLCFGNSVYIEEKNIGNCYPTTRLGNTGSQLGSR